MYDLYDYIKECFSVFLLGCLGTAIMGFLLYVFIIWW